mgnify:CR=1 FL=1
MGLGVLLVLVVSLVGAVVFATGVVRRSWPQTAGALTLDSLTSAVEVVRDGQGVPTIYADTPADLFRAQGFVTAQDRFFQMDLRRKVASGRSAELIGAAGVASDTVMRTLGLRRVAEAELPLLAPSTRLYLNAYAEGVNDLITRAGDPMALGLEYEVLGARLGDERPEKWTAVDSLVWLKAYAFDIAGLDSAELARGRLSATMDAAQLRAIYPEYPSQHPTVLAATAWGHARSSGPADGIAGLAGLDTPDGLSAAAALASAQAALDARATSALVGSGEGLGSNAWVVAGSRTASGAPLLAADPHLAPTQPGAYAQIGLRCRTVSAECPFDVTGITLPGFPGVMAGHTGKIAWATAALGADVSDFYYEQVTGDSSVRDGALVPLQQTTETVKVRGGADAVFTVRRTTHGPILSDIVTAVDEAGRRAVINGVAERQRYAVSLAWTGFTPSRTADAIFGLSTATSFAEFRAAATNYAAPALSVVYADVDGHIGYLAPGQIPVRSAATAGAPAGFVPAPGWQSTWDWRDIVPNAELPWALDPQEGFIVAANNKVTPLPSPYLGSDWDNGWRAARISQLLATGPKLTPADMTRLQQDTFDAFARTLVPVLLGVDLSSDGFTEEAQRLLRMWDFTTPADRSDASAAAVYFYAVWSRLVQGTFDDQLPADLRSDGGPRWRQAVIRLLEDPANLWWDDKRTSGVVENRDEILHRALVQARLDLTRSMGSSTSSWSWGKVHLLDLGHPVLGEQSDSGWIARLFDRGPVPVAGGSAVVLATAFDASKGFRVTSAPAARLVVDLGDLGASTWVLQTGQSGHAGHPHYVDQLDTWVSGGAYSWPFSAESVTATASERLTLVPKP